MRQAVATHDAQVEAHRAVGDVLEVVRELLGPGHLARHAQLREAGDARAHHQPLPVLRDLARTAPRRTRGRIGRGPTMLMSPRSTFQSCGSSSSWAARSTRPEARELVRASRCVSSSPRYGPRRASASGSSVRNLSIVKIAPAAADARRRGRGRRGCPSASSASARERQQRRADDERAPASTTSSARRRVSTAAARSARAPSARSARQASRAGRSSRLERRAARARRWTVGRSSRAQDHVGEQRRIAPGDVPLADAASPARSRAGRSAAAGGPRGSGASSTPPSRPP